MRKVAVVMALAIIVGGFTLQDKNTDQTENPSSKNSQDNIPIYMKLTESCIKLGLEDDSKKKAKLYADIAGDRIDELKKDEDGKNEELIKDLAKSNEKLMDACHQELRKEIDKGQHLEDVKKHVANMTEKHLQILKGVLEKAPDSAKDAIEKAMDNYKKEKEKTDKFQKMSKEKRKEFSEKEKQEKECEREKENCDKPSPIQKFTDECLRFGSCENPQEKAILFAKYALQRLEELKNCKDKGDMAKFLAEADDKYLRAAFQYMSDAAKRGHNMFEVLEEVCRKSKWNFEGLLKALENCPDKAKDVIKQILDRKEDFKKTMEQWWQSKRQWHEKKDKERGHNYKDWWKEHGDWWKRDWKDWGRKDKDHERNKGKGGGH